MEITVCFLLHNWINKSIELDEKTQSWSLLDRVRPCGFDFGQLFGTEPLHNFNCFSGQKTSNYLEVAIQYSKPESILNK